MKSLNKHGKPFLKWAGGKGRLLSTLIENMPKTYNQYFEPFLGGGALFFATNPENAVLSDLNQELIETYRAIKEEPKLVIKKLKKMPNSEEDYYNIRAKNYRSSSGKAARFIYLNRLCFNGIYRVNQKGEFNVPYCKDETRTILFEEDLLRTSEQLQGKKLVHGDFGELTDEILENDFVYIDPPYAVQRKNNGFLEYNKKIFQWEEQIRLSEFAKKLNNKGANVLISNTNAEEVIDLYPNFNLVETYRSCSIGGANATRKRVKEIVLRNY